MAAAATVGSRPGHRTLTAKAVVSTLWEGCKKDWRPLCARKESALPRRGRNVFSDSFLQDGSFQSLPSAPLPQILVGLLQPAWFFVSLVPHRWSTEPDFSTAAKGCSYHSSISERSESLFALVLRFPSRARVLWVPFRAPAWRSPPPPAECWICRWKDQNRVCSRGQRLVGLPKAPLSSKLPGMGTNWRTPLFG